MTLQKMIDECVERLEYYEANPDTPNANILVYCLTNRVEAMLKLQFQNDKDDFYNY